MGVIPYPMSRYYPLRKLLWSRGSLLGFSMVVRPPAIAEDVARIRDVISTRPQHARQSSCLPLARLLAGVALAGRVIAFLPLMHRINNGSPGARKVSL